MVKSSETDKIAQKCQIAEIVQGFMILQFFEALRFIKKKLNILWKMLKVCLKAQTYFKAQILLKGSQFF